MHDFSRTLVRNSFATFCVSWYISLDMRFTPPRRARRRTAGSETTLMLPVLLLLRECLTGVGRLMKPLPPVVGLATGMEGPGASMEGPGAGMEGPARGGSTTRLVRLICTGGAMTGGAMSGGATTGGATSGGAINGESSANTRAGERTRPRTRLERGTSSEPLLSTEFALEPRTEGGGGGTSSIF